MIPHLEVAPPRSWLRLSGRFTREGLDKLFSDTQTKFFTTLVEGEIDWADLSALAGDSLPLQGRWTLTGSLQGDEYHFRVRNLKVGFSETEFLKLERGKSGITLGRPSCTGASIEEAVLRPLPWPVPCLT